MIKNKITTIVLSTVAMVALSGCGDKAAPVEAKTYKLTSAEVYNKSCVKCHGINAEGKPEKKTPRLDDRTIGELEQELFDVKSGGTNQSSGTDHAIMEHNMQKLIEKGYDYDTKDMAVHIHSLFKK
ncbi:MAG: c-type cytochrome [Campylobacterota bacterium]|nr:c-type cytochrome [Campylobacterota bacterium]